MTVRHNIALILLTFLFAGASNPEHDMPDRSEVRNALPAQSSILVFSRTQGFRHESIPSGISAITQLGLAHDFDVESTENPAIFTDSSLAAFDAVVFLNTTGDILDDAQQSALERFIRSGNGFVGIHSAADTEYNWAWYGNLVGAYFDSHPAIQTATVKVLDGAHPSTSMLPKRWSRTDEWYNYRTNPRGTVHVLATLDESTYGGGNQGFDHPIAWCHDYEGGRSWYTGGGHTSASFDEPQFRSHLLGGIQYAAGVAAGDCRATIESSYQLEVIDENTSNPMGVAAADDGRLFIIERAGQIRLYDPGANAVRVAGQLNVSTTQEDGLLGIALDPDFADNDWLYLFYSPAGANPLQRVSRFTMIGNTLDLSSERILLVIPTQRDQCCHSGGDLEFGPFGNLHISTGDDTNPFESDGFAPIDERAGRGPWDAQKSSSNASDLRGKILRIHPEVDGTYTIPAGNLFPADGSSGRPEIYAMGLRNPFRIDVDPSNGWVYWGDVGPDAGSDNLLRGPRGYDEWNQARTAGNFGWPYCIADNKAYRDYDFATQSASNSFVCSAPVNNSPNNTGVTALPPARSAWIWYPYGPSSDFPEITAAPGRTAMAGPIYAFDPATPSSALPKYFDRRLFIYEWSRQWIKEVALDDSGNILAINDFLPSMAFNRPIDLHIGLDGALYIVEWGTGFGGNNADSRVVKITYATSARAPVAIATADPTSGPVPLDVQFSSDGSVDPDGGLLSYAWSFDGDDDVDTTEPNTQHTFAVGGEYTVRLTVTDPDGLTAVSEVQIVAGNTRPVVTINAPPNGGIYDWGDVIAYDVDVVDAEDGSITGGEIECESVLFQTLIGHDTHAHPLDQYTACAGTFSSAEGHGSDADNVFHVVEATFTDSGGPAATPLEGRGQSIIRPKRLQAEHFTQNNGTLLETTGDELGGGQNLGYIDHGDYTAYGPIDLSGIGFVSFRVASAGSGGRIAVRVDSPSGPEIGSAQVEPTGAWQIYRDVTAALDELVGAHTLYFVYTRNPGDTGLFNVNWMEFLGDGIAVVPDDAPDGLRATYFANNDFTGDQVVRVDPVINFNWGTEPPTSAIGSDFSVRWDGDIEAEQSGSFVFYTRADDGVRLWLDGNLIIDEWVSQPATEFVSTPVVLDAGQRYPIVMEYADMGLSAQAHLMWKGRSVTKQTVPRSRLHSNTRAATNSDERPLPETAALGAVFPNPVASESRLQLHLPDRSAIRVDVFDVLGRRMVTVANGIFNSGRHELTINSSDLPNGVYLLRLVGAGRPIVQAFVVVK